MIDPLAEVADPENYVPIASSERALTALAAGLDAGRTPILVVGSSGLGKTLLLRMLADAGRGCGQRVVLSPFLHFPPEDVPRWLLHLMGGAEPGACDESRILAALRDDRRRTLVLVDEAHVAPEASIRWLGELARAARPCVTVVAAASTGPALASRAQALDPELTVTLEERLPIAEIRALYETILALSPSLRRVLDASGEEAVLRTSAGNPALLKNELFRRIAVAARSGVVPSAPRREASPTEPLRAELPRSEPARIEAPPAAPPRPEPPRPELALPEPPRLELPCAEVPIAVAPPLAAPRPAPARPQEAPRLEAPHRTRRGHVIFRRHTVDTRGTVAQEPPRRAVGPRYAPRPEPWLERARSHEEPRTEAPPEAPARQQSPRREPPRRELLRRLTGVARSTIVRTARRRASGEVLRREPASPEARKHGTEPEVARQQAPQLEPARGGPPRKAPKAHAAATAPGPPRPLPGLSAVKAAVALLALGLAFGTAAHGPLDGDTASRPAHPALRAGAPKEPEAALQAPSRPFVGVQVNAHPWARIRVDGRDIGATPLRVPLPPGTYDFEASLPDGQMLRRRVEVGPAQRFVAFQ